MNSKLIPSILVYTLFVVPGVAAEPAELLRLAPSSQNAFAHINVAGLLKTNRAKKENWAKNDRTEYLAGSVPIHPLAEEILATTDFRGKSLHGSGSTLVIPLVKNLEMDQVAGSVGGEKVMLGDMTAVQTRGGMYLVELKPKILGAMQTDHRPELGRWVRGIQEKTINRHSKFLQSAAANIGSDHITIAIDLDEMLDVKDATYALGLNKELVKDEKSMNLIGRYLGSLKGVRLTANFGDSSIKLTVTLDSTVNPHVPADMLKDTIVELVERVGANFKDLSAAQVRIDVTRFIMTFNVTDDELGHLMAIFLPPLPSLPIESTIPVQPGKISQEVTLKYFDAVNKIVDDLRRKSVESPKDYDKTAMWHSTAARKIESLSIIGVDPKAVAYAREIEQLIAAIGASLRGVPIQWNELQGKAYYYQWGRPWNAGWTSTNLPEVWEKQREVIQKDKENRAKIWERIITLRASTMRQLNNASR